MAKTVPHDDRQVFCFDCLVCLNLIPPVAPIFLLENLLGPLIIVIQHIRINLST